MTFPATIIIAGATWPTALPSLSIREDLITRMGSADSDMNMIRLHAAVAGLCSGVGAASKSSLPRMEYRLLEYGDQVYNWLRARGATIPEIVDVALLLVRELPEMAAPREAEVGAAVGFSPPVAGE